MSIDGAEVRLRFVHKTECVGDKDDTFDDRGIEHRMSVTVLRKDAPGRQFTIHERENLYLSERMTSRPPKDMVKRELLRRLLSAVAGEMLGEPEGD